MADDTKSFFQTLPGILTASATALTAITGLIIALNQVGFFRSSPQPIPVATTGAQAPTPVQQASAAGQPRSGGGTSDALTGVWLNTLVSSRNGKPDSRLVIRRRSDGALTLQGWGDCEPKECDWGVAPLEIVAGDPRTDLTRLHATTKLVHVVPSKNREEVTYLTLRGTSTANSLNLKRRFESYDNGQLSNRIEKTLTFTKQEPGARE
jgi:hypothetical protein